MKVCINCNNLISKRNKKYCSWDCQQAYQRSILIDLWLAGKHHGMSGSTSRSTGTALWIKYYFIKTFGNKCMRCGWAERNLFTNKIPLSLHHIDGNYKNNKVENLELLCPNCHALTDNFGSRNIGNGRPR